MRAPAAAPPLVSALALAAAASSPAHARADDDYDPASLAWNGLARFVEDAHETGIDVRVEDRLDVSSLAPSDAVLVVYPVDELPLAALSAFMRRGGRLAILDDFGSGDRLFEAYGIARSPGAPVGAASLRGNPDLALATAATAHALTRGVTALVTNHPATLHHDELEPLFTFRERDALVLAGAVGQGRLVAVSDPSVIINNMVELEGNRRFAQNLVRYLEAGTGGVVHVATPATELAAAPGEAERGTFARLAGWLARAAAAEAPPAAIWAFAVVLASIFVVIAVGALPRRSPYDGATMFARPPSSGGFVGRVGFFSRHRRDLSQAVLAYKFELEDELVRLLGLGRSAILGDVVAALRARGVGEPAVAEARSLLIELDRLRQAQDRPQPPPRVPPARFRNIVAAGDRLLSRLGPRA